MSKTKQIFLFLAVLFLAGTIVFAGAPQRRAILDKALAPKPYAEGEVLVKFKPGVELSAVKKFAASKSLKLKRHFKFLSSAKGQAIVLLKSLVKVDADVLAKTLSRLAQVDYATPNYRRELYASPNDPRAGELWGLHNAADHDVNAPEAWDISTGSTGVIVAVIDTGFDYSHPDLAANAWRNPGEVGGNGADDDGNGYIDDVYGIDPAGADGSGDYPDSDPMDGYGHGTHCAGTIGAVGNNGVGVVGVNWNVRIMGLKFFDEAGGNAYDAFAIECIQYAVYQKTHGQNIVAINASWGGVGGSDSGALRDAIEVANNAGIVFCAAAGNGGDDGVGDNNDRAGNHHYPSDFTLPGIISVMATDSSDNQASFSNYGATSVDLAAPGVGILSTLPGTDTGNIFFDNIESGSTKWTLGGTSNWAISENQEGWADVNFPVPSPTHFWSDSPVGSYANNTDSWIMNSTPINLTGYTGQKVCLGFGAAWCIGIGDHGLLQISKDGGSSWKTMYDQVNDGYYYKWSRYNVAIPEDYKVANFRFRFRFTSDATGTNYWGMLIDDVGIGTAAYSYEAWDGTSMATPHVAGAVGLMASRFASETVAQRKARILDHAEVLASLNNLCVTEARLDLYASINASSSSPSPSITVTSPNGGEVWTIGSSYNITWTSMGTFTSVEIHYSLDSGATWIEIDPNDPNDGTFSWTVPAVTPSANCLVRVRERNTNTPSDASDAVFAIVPASSETVSTPTAPSGPTAGSTGVAYSYSTGGSASSLGDSVQYGFDWGDGSPLAWLPVGTTSATHTWLAAGTFTVRGRARCSIHYLQSSWSTPVTVTLGDVPTWTAVSCFKASAEEEMPTVEWQTGTEMGAAGFNLWRRDHGTGEYELVNPSLLPALPASPAGGVYRFADPGAFPGELVTYRLEEVNVQGRTMSYGPFTVVFGVSDWNDPSVPTTNMGTEEPSGIDGYRRFERARTQLEEARLLARQQERLQEAHAFGNLAGSGPERVRVTVKGKGLFYVTAAQIASSLNIAEAAAQALIGNYNLILTGQGQEIAWLADINGNGLFFYNEGKEMVYSDRNVYFLERGSGRAMEAVSGGNAGPADSGQIYQEGLHFEGNFYALVGPTMDPAGDLWFWDYVIAGGGDKSFAIQVPGAAAAGKATLTMRLQGATDSAASNDHHAVVALNGRRIGEAVWDGIQAHDFAVAFDASQLQEGANSVTVSGLLDSEAPYAIFYVESFELSYPRYYKAVDNGLICRGDGNTVITVSGLTEAQAVVLDVTAPDRPKQLTGVAPDQGGNVTFVPYAKANTYLVSGLNAALRPLSVSGGRSGDLNGLQGIEHMVIAPTAFATTAQELADYRQGKGLKSKVVTLEDIYDAYSYGVPNPYAIRDFLAQLYGKKLKYVVLAGKGTYDYNDYLGNGDNLVPAILGVTPEGLCAADGMYGDVKGRDGLPEIAIGRLPAMTNAELQAMIAKIKEYESSQGEWTDKGLFIADNADNGGDFASGSDELAALATGFQAEKLYLTGSASELRGQIIASWNAGAGLVNYFGHAGITQLAAENILSAADGASLRNAGQLPLAGLFTCVAGRFEMPGVTSLAEALLLNANGGMAGALAPSGAARHADSLRLGGEFYKAAFMGKAESAGQALLAAMKAYVQQGGNAYLLNIYNWLGDPAITIR